jgi:hypothetical protein
MAWLDTIQAIELFAALIGVALVGGLAWFLIPLSRFGIHRGDWSVFISRREPAASPLRSREEAARLAPLDPRD